MPMPISCSSSNAINAVVSNIALHIYHVNNVVKEC